MGFEVPKESFSGRVYEVTIGKDKTVTFGGENTLPFHFFEGEVPHRPLVAYEIQDIPPEDWPETIKEPFKDVFSDPVTWAKHCVDNLGAKAIALRLMGTHPDQKDLGADHAVEVTQKVLETVDVPLIILGSNHVEKDAEVLPKVAEVSKGYNCVIGKAQEANYKTIAAAAMASGHKLIAMSELDINLSKQLNIMLTQMGFEKERIIIDPMCSALGYGIEYTYSVMERIRLAALAQADPIMQPPMVADVGMYVWKIKEVQAPEETLPEWGSLKDRAVLWEAMTATTLMIAGAELAIMRHPEAVALVERFIDEMFAG
jgi:acetyl-CoA decarbonylase/synthase complex subunit delta